MSEIRMIRIRCETGSAGKIATNTKNNNPNELHSDIIVKNV